MPGEFTSSRRDFIRTAGLSSCLALIHPLSFATGMVDDRTAWYRDAKFGMFIHWGPYSLASVEASWPIMTPKAGGIAEAEYRELPKSHCNRLTDTLPGPVTRANRPSCVLIDGFI
jgi:hypothetical protein